jgi:hypothetical protein
MADINTRIRLSATDDASAKISQVKKNLAGLLSSQGMAGNILGGAVAGGVMGLTAGLMDAIPAMGQAAWDMGVMAAQAERTEASFASLADRAGISGQAMLQAMRSASQGTVADVDLMAAANRGLVLGVADSAAEMADLVEAAIIRGRDVGVGATQAVNDLVTGIGRMSPEILDNLGIANASGAFKEYAAQLGTTADKLTEVQKKQALVNAVLASTEGVSLMDDAAGSFERMDAAIKNMQGELGELFGPAIAAVAQALADAARGVTDALNDEGIAATRDRWAEINTEISTTQERIQELQNLLRDIEGIEPAWLPPDKQQYAGDEDAIRAQIAGLQEHESALQADAAAARIAAIEAQGLKDVTAQTEEAFLAATWSSFGFKASLDTVGAAAGSAASQVEIFNAALSRMQPVLSSVTGIRQAAIARVESMGLQAVQQGADPSEVTEMVANATDAIWNMGLSYDATTEAQFANRLAVEAQLDPLSQLNDKLREADKASSSLAKGGLSDAERAFGSLRSRVESMLSGSLSPDVSIPEGLIPRADDINENARRLAAIANEGIGDQSWMEEFKAEVPAIFDEIIAAADPKAKAAQIFTEFQAGLRPELIDRELVKQRIRDAILGENNMSQLATEIATELSKEMGLSLPQALAAAQNALGVTPTGNTDQFGSGFEEGIDAQATAAGSLAKIAKAFLENESNVRASGGVVGAWWGEGFMAVVGDNVPPGLLDMLTSKLLPLILAGIAQRNSTSGTSDGN